VRDEIKDFDNYNEYKRDFPRLRSLSCISPPSTFVILADKSYGLHPLMKNAVSHERTPRNVQYSSQIMDLIPATDLTSLPIPRLPPFFIGLCQRYIDSHDDIAMIAAEQLVDGMDLDEAWCSRNLQNASQEVYQLATRLVEGKDSRLDDFSENTITCFISNAGEAKRLKQIPGYE